MQIAFPPTTSRPHCQWVAAARGDGAIALFDVDISSSACGASGHTMQVVSPAPPRGGERGGSSSGGGGLKGKGQAPSGALSQPLVLDLHHGGHSAPTSSVAYSHLPRSSSSSSAGGQEGCSNGSSGDGSSRGLAAAAGPCGGLRLYSGGEDKRIVAWDLDAACLAVAAQRSAVSAAAAAGALGSEAAGAPSSDSAAASPEARDDGARPRKAVVAEVLHTRKVNQLCCTAVGGTEVVVVAAVSKFVALYKWSEPAS